MNKDKEQLKDLLSAVREDSVTALVESDFFKSGLLDITSQLLSGPAAPIIGSILGAVAPRINGVYLSYKQNRFERNINRALIEIKDRIAALENNYVNLNTEIKEQYQGAYVEMLLDSIIDERQEEKIKWCVNGFVELMTNDSNDNIMQFFFDTLTELTVLDIDTLRLYSSDPDINWHDIEIKYGIDSDRLNIIKEKLVRLGLLYRKNDRIRDDSLDNIIEYLLKKEKDSKLNRPHGVKLPSSIKKISRIDSYRITQLGSAFLKSIGVL